MPTEPEQIAQKLPPLAEIIALIENRPRTIYLEHISRDCSVSLSWLAKLLAGDIKEPSYQRIKCIFEYLNSKA